VKYNKIFFISSLLTLFVFFSQTADLAAKNDEYFVVGLTQSGVKEILAEINQNSFQHPVSLNDRNLFKILRSLYYSNWDRGFSRWEYRKPVFQSSEAKELVFLILENLGKSSPKQMVYFSMGTGPQQTKGNIFAAGSKLYFYFQTIQGTKQKWEQAGESHEQWKFVPQKEQKYLEKKNFLGITGIETDWIIVDLPDSTPAIKKGDTDATEPSVSKNAGKKSGQDETIQPQKDYGEAKTKLKYLKELLSGGLITPEDYDREKKKLLDGL
jgi:hypothetical protein